MEELQIVVFALNNEMCGVDTMQVKEIVKYQDVTKAPQMPDFVEGLINLRGHVIPVINLNRRFGLCESPVDNRTKIIITEIEAQLIGFIVDEVREIIKLRQDDVESAPDILSKAGNTYIKGIAKKENQLISVLDLTKVLHGSEVNMLKDKNK